MTEIANNLPVIPEIQDPSREVVLDSTQARFDAFLTQNCSIAPAEVLPKGADIIPVARPFRPLRRKFLSPNLSESLR